MSALNTNAISCWPKYVPQYDSVEEFATHLSHEVALALRDIQIPKRIVIPRPIHAGRAAIHVNVRVTDTIRCHRN